MGGCRGSTTTDLRRPGHEPFPRDGTLPKNRRHTWSSRPAYGIRSCGQATRSAGPDQAACLLQRGGAAPPTRQRVGCGVEALGAAPPTRRHQIHLLGAGFPANPNPPKGKKGSRAYGVDGTVNSLLVSSSAVQKLTILDGTNKIPAGELSVHACYIGIPDAQ